MVKLFIFAVFFYVVYRLLTGGFKKRVVGSPRQTAAPGALAVHDELVEDPVCHIYIPKRQAIVLHGSDTPVYFCSEQCRKMYCDAQKTDRQENG